MGLLTGRSASATRQGPIVYECQGCGKDYKLMLSEFDKCNNCGSTRFNVVVDFDTYGA